MHAIRQPAFVAAVIAAALVPSVSFAQDELERNGFVLGAWAGYGAMKLNTRYPAAASSSSGTLAMGIKVGYALGTRVTAGVEANGWTLHAYDNTDPTRGEALSNASLFANYFPLETLPLFFEAGGGETTYINNAPAVSAHDTGSQRFVGAGYEYALSGGFFLVPQVRYARGDFGGGNFRVWEAALGVTWYSGRVR